MELKINFTNGTAPVNFNENVVGATPVELLIANTGSVETRRHSLGAYVRSLDYTFRGVSNYASGKIAGLSVSKDWFGTMGKNREAVLWNAISDKIYVVVYDLAINSIIENMYVADGVAISPKRTNQKTVSHSKKKSSEEFKGVEPLWVTELLSPIASENILKDMIIKSIAIVAEYVQGYKLVWGHKGKDGFTVLNPNGSPTAINSIADDGTFILIKLLTLLLGKGTHQGVFLIDCDGFSDSILDAFAETAKLFYGDTFVFVYNVAQNSKLTRVQTVLPNFLG
jgi:hypothetical protein